MITAPLSPPYGWRPRQPPTSPVPRTSPACTYAVSFR
uniref:Uncharacterized protein n=1 Tax=Anguilla anguilla TaxID=7936 RepID=A0A0E9V776_ANGAN